MIFVPKYYELSTKNVWQLIKDLDEVSVYFPDLSESQLPDRKFMWTVLSTVKENLATNIVNNARLNRSLGVQNDEDNLIEIKKDILEQIRGIPSKKGELLP